jgi:hypothetical protein
MSNIYLTSQQNKETQIIMPHSTESHNFQTGTKEQNTPLIKDNKSAKKSFFLRNIGKF